jgi:hypothetical protein
MKIETPRTDAESKRVRTNCDELTEPVSAELARQLERELITLGNQYKHSLDERHDLIIQNQKLLGELTQIKSRRRDA